MYTAVLMAALTSTTGQPAWGHSYGCSCYNGFPYSYNPGCYAYPYYPAGFAGGAYGYHGGCYGAYGGVYDPGYGGCTGCYGCYGGHSCYGYPVPVAPAAQKPFVAPPPRDYYPPINPPKKEVAPEKDGAEDVGAPKEKPKSPDIKKVSDDKKQVMDTRTPIRARVRIEVPEGGKLFVDDRPINVPAGVRVFQTPLLARDERYYYDIRIEHAGEIRSRRVVIEPGQEAAVSFPSLTPVARADR